MRIKHNILVLLVLMLFGCEEEVDLSLPTGEEMLVVEGHIEQGTPPLVVLTRSVPVFNKLSADELEASFVHGARVVVQYGGEEYLLVERPVARLGSELKRLLSDQFAITAILLEPGSDFIFYVYTTDKLSGEVGGNYGLRVNYDGKTVTSSTTIPHLNPLKELFAAPHPDLKNDSLFTLFYRYSDPDTLGNSVRYFTQRNREPFYPGLLTSVFNDELINGARSLTFPLGRGVPQGQELDPETAGYFTKGDTVTVKWSAIDLAHFRFWSTLEGERSSNGSPIGSPNSTRSNINGGLGIWGGYGSTYHKIIIK